MQGGQEEISGSKGWARDGRDGSTVAESPCLAAGRHIQSCPSAVYGHEGEHGAEHGRMNGTMHLALAPDLSRLFFYFEVLQRLEQSSVYDTWIVLYAAP